MHGKTARKGKLSCSKTVPIFSKTVPIFSKTVPIFSKTAPFLAVSGRRNVCCTSLSTLAGASTSDGRGCQQFVLDSTAPRLVEPIIEPAVGERREDLPRRLRGRSADGQTFDLEVSLSRDNQRGVAGAEKRSPAQQSRWAGSRDVGNGGGAATDLGRRDFGRRRAQRVRVLSHARAPSGPLCWKYMTLLGSKIGEHTRSRDARALRRRR